MPVPVESWPRPYYRPGGGDAFLFYVVYGPTPQSFSISRSKYRCDGIPNGIDLVSYGPASSPEVVNSFRSGYLWEELQRSEPALAGDLARQSECLVIRGDIPDPRELNYFRNVVGLVSWLLDCGSVAVYDSQMFKWWTPSEWRATIFEPASALPRHHAVILVSEDESGTEWFHTRGMRKFGRPDLSVHRVPADLRGGVVDLCNRFIEYQAFGGIIEEGEEVRMHSLPAGLTCTHQGSLDDPEFNNVHVEITWPSGAEPCLASDRQTAAPFGSGRAVRDGGG